MVFRAHQFNLLCFIDLFVFIARNFHKLSMHQNCWELLPLTEKYLPILANFLDRFCLKNLFNLKKNNFYSKEIVYKWRDFLDDDWWFKQITAFNSDLWKHETLLWLAVILFQIPFKYFNIYENYKILTHKIIIIIIVYKYLNHVTLIYLKLKNNR